MDMSLPDPPTKRKGSASAWLPSSRITHDVAWAAPVYYKPLDSSRVSLRYIVLVPTACILMASATLWKKASISEQKLSVPQRGFLLFQQANWELNKILR